MLIADGDHPCHDVAAEVNPSRAAGPRGIDIGHQADLDVVDVAAVAALLVLALEGCGLSVLGLRGLLAVIRDADADGRELGAVGLQIIGIVYLQGDSAGVALSS